MCLLFAVCIFVGVLFVSVGVCWSAVFWSVGAVGVLECPTPTMLE